MRVYACRGAEHGSFCFKADNPKTCHATAFGAGFCQSVEVGLDCGGAAAECTGVHIRMAAGVDVTDKSGLGPGFQLVEQAAGCNGSDGFGIMNATRSDSG